MKLLRTASHLALTSAILSGLAIAAPAAAQDAAPMADESEDGGEIVVTARRREERIIDVPVSVSAFGQEELSNQGANDLSALQGSIPNTNMVQGRGSASSANFFIRGIGQPDALQTFDPAIGVYVDGIYLSRIQGALLALGDVERVEVLRGPQGTLYGKNTIGGAINVVSRKPDLAATHLEASATYGSFDQLTFSGYASTPLGDSAALSVAAQRDTRDGIVTDPLTGKKYNDKDSTSGRAILRLEPSDAFSLTASADYTRQRNALNLGYATAPIIRTNFLTGAVILHPANPYGDYDYKASTSFTNGEGQKLDHWGTSLTAAFDLSDAVTLKSITGYRELETKFYVDIDATQAEIGDVFVGTDQSQFTQELQLLYSSDKISGLFGAYYLDEKVSSHQEAYADDLFAFGALPITFTRFIDDKQRTKSYAAFGQVTVNVSDQLALTGGLRYTKEDKFYNRTTRTASSLASLNNLVFTFPDNLPAPLNGSNKASFDAWTPMATLSYKPTADVMVYASASRGFKSGGFNGRANSLADLTFYVDGSPQLITQFKPETVWTYELGAKGSFLNGNVMLSAAAFHSDYKDFQARVGGGVDGGAGVGVFPVLNAGKLTIQGIEFDAAVKPVDALTLRLSVGYLDADYKKFADGRRVPPQTFSCNPTGTKIVCQPAFAPPLTLRGGFDYTRQVSDGATLKFGGDVRFVDKQFLSVDNRPGLTERGYAVANAYVQLDFADGKFYVRGNAKNLFDTLYKTDGQEFSSVGNIQTVYYGDPRTFSITAGIRF